MMMLIVAFCNFVKAPKNCASLIRINDFKRVDYLTEYFACGLANITGK